MLLVLDNGTNDSIAYAVGFFDIRGEKGRDKTLDISQNRFNTSNFLTKDQRCEQAEVYAKEKFFHEKYTKEEEEQN